MAFGAYQPSATTGGYLSTDPNAGLNTAGPSINGGSLATGGPPQSLDNSFSGYGSNPAMQALREAFQQGLTGQDALNYVNSKAPNSGLTWDPTRGNFDLSTGGPNGLQIDTNAQGVWGVHPYNDAFGGGGNGTGGIGPGSLINHVPTAQEAWNAPGADFWRQNALDAVQHSAAAKGTLLTGGTLKDLANYAGQSGLANTYFPLANLQLGVNQANTGNLFNLANLGVNAANSATQ